MKQVLTLATAGEAFEPFCNSFNGLLTRVLNEMERKDVEEARISITLDILQDRRIESYTDDEEAKEYIQPTFKHKMTSMMKIKDEASGMGGGDGYALEWDPTGQQWFMREVDDGQERMY